MSHLKLKATTIEECDIISSLFQDSIFHVQCHSFDNDKGCFHLLLNRFCWEDLSNYEQDKCYYRANSGLYIHNVTDVKVNKSFKNNRHNYLTLLAIHASENEINIMFSDNKHVCISVNGILVYLQDLHEKYPTLTRPQHECLSDCSVTL